MVQIDMPMPTNCLDCPACNEYLTCAIPVNGRKWGENDVRDFSQSRPDWCPMKEQEAVPVIQREVMHMLVWCCGSCGVTITDGDKFCRDCGKKMKWCE